MKQLFVTLSEVKLSVMYNYSYDPGVYTYPNGDPGYPPNEEIEIIQITTDGDIQPLLSNYTKTQEIMNKIEERISKYERNG